MLNENGIVEFYYTKTLPSEAVAIAQISGIDFAPADLITINNQNIINQGTLSVWKSTSSISGAADFVAPDINQTITIHGDTTYYVGCQFFEITNIQSDIGTALYYNHLLPNGIVNANILDSSGNIISTDSLIQNNRFYHSLPDGYYQIRYVDSNGFVQVEMLLFTPVIDRSVSQVSANLYLYSASRLAVLNSGNYFLRFTNTNGYKVLAPYNAPSNVPWFVRISYGITPTPPEWGTQSFVPFRPYLLGTWVKGAILNSSTIQFERRQIYNNSGHLPDILIFNKDNQFKYALDGTALAIVSTKGYLYNWKKGLINSVDNYTGRVSVAVDLDPTDLVFGFYSYEEDDIVYTALDVNPFTNPLVKNTQVTFYFKTNGVDTTKYIYYKIQDNFGNVIQTNDTNPSTGTNATFSQLVIGASVSPSELTVNDIRVRGGGLSAPYQNIPEAVNFWDLGYWNGKPYPVASAMIVYLPQSILNSMSESDVANKVSSILPLGLLPVIKYYDVEGNEY